MISDEREAAFFSSMDTGNSEELGRIEEKALAEKVPIIRPDTQSFLRTLLALQKPVRILEVGCAVGFSALLMAENTPGDTTITTVEKDLRRAEKAEENFRTVKNGRKITLLTGDAGEVLVSLQGPFDFIFMDAAKGQYPLWLPQILRLLAPGGVLLSDNVLREGDILESRFAVERRNRTIYKRMREYLHELTHSDRLVTSILPVGDGLALSVKK